MASGERSLRKLIAELAEMREHACGAVLAELDEVQRAKVRALLGEYAGERASLHAALPPLDPRRLPPGLSPWLADLLDESHDAGVDPDDRSALTAETRHALRACAEELRQAAGGAEPVRTSRWKTLRNRVSAIRIGDIRQ